MTRRADMDAQERDDRPGVTTVESRTARQFWIQAPGEGAIVRADLAPRAADEVLVRATHSAISRGTETLVYRGEVPPSQYTAMRAPFQEGEFPAPVKYGYASVGEVIEGPAASGLPGRMVFCLFPHQDLYCVSAAAVTPVPDGVPAERAVLAASMETATTIMWDARPAVGDRIVIMGGGVLGLLVAWMCRRIPGASVTLVDPNVEREVIARTLGVTWRADPPGSSTADLVIHASGHAEGLRTALDVAAVEATVVEASWFGCHPVSLPLGEGFHAKRLTIRSSQVGRIPPDHAPRWSRESRMRLALDLLRAPELDALITGESRFEDLPEVMTRLSQDARGEVCHRIRYRDV